MYIRAYARASTKKQDATRAKETLRAFVQSHKQRIAAFYVENVSGTTLSRPELLRLLEESDEGDALIVESIDRLTRLNLSDWETLRAMLERKSISVISLDLPTSHMVLMPSGNNDFMQAVLKAINRMLLDLLAASAYKELKERERKQLEGINKAKLKGKYKGRSINVEHFEAVKKLTHANSFSINDIAKTVGVSRSTVIRYRKQLLKQEI